MDDVSEKADKLIKDFAFGSSFTGLIPIPFMDMLGLISVQRIMLMRLSKLYAVPYSKNIAKAMLSTLMTGLASKAATPVIGSAIKTIPVIGTVAGGASMFAISGASTYAIGKVFQQHFERGGTLEDFDPNKAKKTLLIELEKGKRISDQQKK